MTRAGILATVLGLLLVPAAPAQTAGWRFRWQPGQVLNYRVEQVTTAIEVLEGKQTDSTTKMRVGKRWQVLAVDAAGVATVQKVLTALRLETTSSSGDVLLFDSAEPDKSNPQMREQLSKYVGQPLEVLRVDGYGRVVEVKECKYGSAAKFESDLPFVVMLPETVPQQGQAWERNYNITLEPPKGTNEKYAAVQKYTCKSVAGNLATLGLTTVFKSLPESQLDRLPLLQLQPEGDVVFDVQAGIFRSARLRIEKEMTGYQGEGSSYKFTSTYVEEYLGNP